MQVAIEAELWRRIKHRPVVARSPAVDIKLDGVVIERVPEYTRLQSVRDIIGEMLQEDLIKSPKQAWATLEKWEKAGLYDCGVAFDLGWLNEGAQFPRMQELVQYTTALTRQRFVAGLEEVSRRQVEPHMPKQVLVEPPVEWWGIFDARDDKPVTSSSFRSEEAANEQIAAWRARDKRGIRPDCHDVMPHMVARPWGDKHWPQKVPAQRETPHA